MDARPWAQDGAGYAVDGANAVAGWAPGAMDTAGGGGGGTKLELVFFFF